MKQELIQIQKLLSFKDVAPEWAEAIDNTSNLSEAMEYAEEKFNRHYGMKRCLVGEVHGSNFEWCRDCLEFSLVKSRINELFGRDRACYVDVTRDDLHMWQKAFMAHYNEVHGHD